MKDIQLVDIDYTGSNPDFKKTDKVDLSKISAPWIVPEEGPFYGDSIRIIKGGLDVDNKLFKPVEMVTDLTEKTGRAVYLYVQLDDTLLSSLGELEFVYQRVGLPVISIKTLLQMLEDMIITGKPVDWETQITGKPKTYYPAQHWHDIQNKDELVGFGGLVELFTMFTNDQKTNGPKQVAALNKIQDDMYNRLDYIQKLKWSAIYAHFRNYRNPHGALPVDVDAGNLSNFFTATPQQDADATRSDLYSTPVGLERIISETEPVTEDYLVQAELPFGYYGSGIYLPPPITGSFEGLGGDSENSAMTVEGNGWLTCLFRAFDGRVKNLYYAYKTDYKERNATLSPWLDTYVQYQHPTITAAGKTPNYVIDGSDGVVLMVGNVPDPTGPAILGDGNWWICAANSTFDPSSHNLKPVNMTAVLDEVRNLTGSIMRPGTYKISKVGNWVYLFADASSFQGDDEGNYSNRFPADHWQTVMFRFPFTDLSDDTKKSITFTRVNVSYDTLWRERRTNKNTFIPQRMQFSDAGKTLATEYGIKFNAGVSQCYMNRKKGWVIVPNPNNPRLARIKLLIAPFATYVEPGTQAQRAAGFYIVINYDWDVESNILTLASTWSMPTGDVLNTNGGNGNYIGLTQAQQDYVLAGSVDGMFIGYVNTCMTYIPGFGAVAMRSEQTGTPPYNIRTWQINRDGNKERDYEYMSYPNHWTITAGVDCVWQVPFKMKSPFGVAGFPRAYSDLYSLTSGVRQYPIEIFTAENEDQTQQTFYRVTEGGDDDTYDQRSALQSTYVPFPIRGRKTNSNFGTVTGVSMDSFYTNRPGRKTAQSKAGSGFSWWRQGINRNSGAAYNWTRETDKDGFLNPIVPGADGSIVVNLDMDYTLDSVGKRLNARPNVNKQVRIPRSVYSDMVMSALGNHANTLIDLCVDFYIGGQPGTGGDQVFSFWSATYHLTGSPAATRMIIGTFTWDVASTGADGIRVLKVVGMQYPFTTTQYANSSMNPGNDSNILVTGFHTLDVYNQWNIFYGTGFQTRFRHTEVLDFQGEGAQNMEIAWFSGLQLQISGNGATSRVIFRRRNNKITEATVGVRQGQAYNYEYSWQLTANAQLGWLAGVGGNWSGAAMNLQMPWDGRTDIYEPNVIPSPYLVMYGATYVEGNWSLFVNSEVPVVFNGYSTIAKQANWDLRDLTDVYRRQTFYIYCVSDGSTAFYEITKTLRSHNAAHVLVGIVTTDDFGIVTIERRQSFSIAGFPLTRTRDMGIPVSSGTAVEDGTYKFLKRSELYNN